MNKEEFLTQLERLLSGISEEERADAIAFYRSYFEDAGEENEASVISELESPEKVAEIIMKDLGVNTGTYQNSGAYQNTSVYGNEEPPKKKDNTARTVGIVVAVLTAPIWLTVLLIIAALLLGIISALLGIALAVVGVMAALVVAGFLLIGIGFASMIGGSPAVGVCLTGVGLLVLAVGVLALVLVVWVFGGFLPWAIRGIVKLCRKPFEKRKERAAV